MKKMLILKLAIIAISIFATSSVLQAQYASFCEQDCSSPSMWRDTTVLMSLPQWPDCDILYTFQTRTCDNLNYEIRGGQITVLLMPGCDSLWNWVFANPSNQEQPKNRIEEIIIQAYQKVSDDYFMKLFNAVPAEHRAKVFNCDNPPENRGGGITTYIRAKCASYCAAQWFQEGEGLVSQFTFDNCQGEGCCKLTRTYCFDVQADTVQVTETTEAIAGTCDTAQTMPQPGCYPLNVTPMFLYRSPCEPICDDN